MIACGGGDDDGNALNDVWVPTNANGKYPLRSRGGTVCQYPEACHAANLGGKSGIYRYR
jgi:hypothetical protein